MTTPTRAALLARISRKLHFAAHGQKGHNGPFATCAMKDCRDVRAALAAPEAPAGPAKLERGASCRAAPVPRRRPQGADAVSRTFADLQQPANAIEIGGAVAEGLEADGQVNALAMQLDTLLTDRLVEASKQRRDDRVDYFLGERLRIARRLVDESVAVTLRILQHEITTLEQV